MKEKGEDYDFIVSGAIGHAAESPEVKVWRVENNGIKLIHNLTGHSLGIVSVDVSPNGKCKKNSKHFSTVSNFSHFQTSPAVHWTQLYVCGMLPTESF